MNIDMVCHGYGRHDHLIEILRTTRLTSETVQSAALSLESVDDLGRMSVRRKMEMRE